MLLKKYEKDIAMLKQELSMHNALSSRTHIEYDPYTDEQKYEIQKILKSYLNGAISEIDIVSVRQMRELLIQFKQMYNNMPVERYVVLCNFFYNSPSKTPGALPLSSSAPSGDDRDVDKDGIGELDGGGFSLGVAPANAKPADKIKTKKDDKVWVMVVNLMSCSRRRNLDLGRLF